MEVYHFLKDHNIDLLAEIPFAKSYAGKYAAGNILENITPEMEDIYRKIITKLELKIAAL
jgi:MinD superfamily P-loop ATPase